MNKSTPAVAIVLGCGFSWMNIPQGLAAPTKVVPKRTTAKKVAPAPLIQGKVRAVARTPRPGSVPYKDAVIALHLIDVKALSGKLPKKSILVYAWGMRSNRLASAASYRVGQTATLSVIPWEKAERKYGRYQRVELDDSETLTLDTYWGDPKK